MHSISKEMAMTEASDSKLSVDSKMSSLVTVSCNLDLTALQQVLVGLDTNMRAKPDVGVLR